MGQAGTGGGTGAGGGFGLEFGSPSYSIIPIKGILGEVLFLGGSALLLFDSVRAMASCNYGPQQCSLMYYNQTNSKG